MFINSEFDVEIGQELLIFYSLILKPWINHTFKNIYLILDNVIIERTDYDWWSSHDWGQAHLLNYQVPV